MYILTGMKEAMKGRKFTYPEVDHRLLQSGKLCSCLLLGTPGVSCDTALLRRHCAKLPQGQM
jgi:hypothetical protein